MLSEGLKILCIGMGVVFCFLIVMVWVMQLSSAVIIKFFPNKPEPVVQAVTGNNDKAKIAAAIAIAMSQKA